MPWNRTLSLDDADDKVLEAMAQQRTLYPREYAQPVQELDRGLPGIVASHTLIPEALYHAFATFGALWKKAVDRASSRVARVTCASATIVLLSRLGLCTDCRSPHDNRRLVWDHRGTDAVSCMKILVFSRGDDERLKRRPEAEMLRRTNRESGPHSAGRPGRSDDEIAPTRRR